MSAVTEAHLHGVRVHWGISGGLWTVVEEVDGHATNSGVCGLGDRRAA